MNEEIEPSTLSRQIERQEPCFTLLPYLSTEAQMLDAASLNEGRASGFDVASVKARKALSAVDGQ